MIPLGFSLLVGGTLLFVFLLIAAARLRRPDVEAKTPAKPFVRYYVLLALALLLVLAGYGLLKTRGYW